MVAEFPSAPVDFAPANQAMCSPGAMFYDKVVVHRMTEYGPLSVEGNQVTLREKEGKKIVTLSSGEELRVEKACFPPSEACSEKMMEKIYSVRPLEGKTVNDKR